MRHGLMGVLMILTIVTLPAVAQDMDQQTKWCMNRGGEAASDLQIGACTALIQSGRLSTANLAIIFYNRGCAYWDARQDDRAIQDFDQAIRLNPNDADFFNNRGNAHARNGQRDRAIQDFDQAIRLKPTFHNVKMRLALSRRSWMPSILGQHGRHFFQRLGGR